MTAKLIQNFARKVAARHPAVARDLMGLAGTVEAAYTFPRDFHLPKSVRGTPPNVDAQGTDVAIWTYDVDRAGKPNYCAIAFVGKQSKPFWDIIFASEQDRQRVIDQTIRNRKALIQRKRDEQAARSTYQHDFKQGDLLVRSWGYDQTNIDYYEVTKVLGPQMIEIREIGKRWLGGHGSSDRVAPDAGKFTGPPMRKRVGPGGRIRLDSYSSVGKWDGRPNFQTNPMFGH